MQPNDWLLIIAMIFFALAIACGADAIKLERKFSPAWCVAITWCILLSGVIMFSAVLVNS